jgi:hypothetical protein
MFMQYVNIWQFIASVTWNCIIPGCNSPLQKFDACTQTHTHTTGLDNNKQIIPQINVPRGKNVIISWFAAMNLKLEKASSWSKKPF